jgi:hypothetical protein
MKKNHAKIKLYVPKWVSVVFTIFAVLLVPWIIFLAETLPVKHVIRHWDVAWVVLDLAILVLLLVTGVLAAMKSRLVIITLVATSSFLIVDAWFDIATSRGGDQFIQSIILAAVFEIPLAVVGLILAYKTINKNLA